MSRVPDPAAIQVALAGIEWITFLSYSEGRLEAVPVIALVRLRVFLRALDS